MWLPDSSDVIKNLTTKEKEIWDAVVLASNSVIEELESSNMLRRISHPENLNILKVIENSNRFSLAYNKYNDLFSTKRIKEFEKVNTIFNFDSWSLAYIYFALMMYVFTAQLELFKNALLTVLRRRNGITGRETLGSLLDNLERIAPKNAHTLSKHIDVDLRNSIVHGWYWFGSRVTKVYFADNPDLINPTEMALGDLMIKAKKHNIVCQAFIYAYPRKIKELREK